MSELYSDVNERMGRKYQHYGTWFEDLDPDMRMVQPADDLHDAMVWAQAEKTTVVGSDDGKTWYRV